MVKNLKPSQSSNESTNSLNSLEIHDKASKILAEIRSEITKSRNPSEVSEEKDQIKDLEKVSLSPKETQESPKKGDEVNLNYKGNKHYRGKGTNAERIDILYKNFLRSIRRYLWHMFTSEYDIKQIKGWKQSREAYIKYLKEFYEKHFQKCFHQIYNPSEKDEEIFIEI